MTVLIDRNGDWIHELRSLKKRCGIMQQSLFTICCQLQHDPASVDFGELFRQASALRAARQRVKELERVANWVATHNPSAND